jgi:hypothetical protein
MLSNGCYCSLVGQCAQDSCAGVGDWRTPQLLPLNCETNEQSVEMNSVVSSGHERLDDCMSAYTVCCTAALSAFKSDV